MPKWLENGAEKSQLAVAFTLRRGEIVWKRHFCRNNLSTVSTRSEMKTERFAASCEHKRRYLFVPLANQASRVSKQ
jgi:hypothetical protein